MYTQRSPQLNHSSTVVSYILNAFKTAIIAIMLEFMIENTIITKSRIMHKK